MLETFVASRNIVPAQDITLDDAETLLRCRLGLIFGPGIVTSNNIFEAISVKLAAKSGEAPRENYTVAAQEALLRGIKDDEIILSIEECVAAQTPFPQITRVAGLNWSAAISLTFDAIFERDFTRACERKASTFLPTQVSRFPQVVPIKTIPVFKLLGSLEHKDVVASEVAYRVRRSTWRYALREFADRTKGSPIIGLGLKDCAWIFLDLLSEILAEPKTTLSPLLLVRSDFDSAASAAITQLAHDRINISFVNASLADLISRIRDVEKAGATPHLPAQIVARTDRLSLFEDIVVRVNTQLRSDVDREESARLLDLLFSPTIPRWDPFHHNLDFRRTVSNRLVSALVRTPPATGAQPAFALVGSAACGKTTAAKRVAYDLASKGNLVFWFRRAFYPNVHALLADFFKALAEVADRRQRIFFFIDDPLGLGSLSIQGIAANAQLHGIACTFVVVARSSDWKTHQPHEITGALELVQDFEVSDEFDGQEMQALPGYLVSLGIFSDKATAKHEIEKAPSRSTSDTLGLLYWLLPKTRQSIEASIQQEYFRLGERAGFSRIIIGAYTKTTDFLRSAYGMVAVSDRYHTPLPVEVLVSALEVPYRDWIDTVGTHGPAWGLLYGEMSPDEQTTCYRPRNAVVTRILVETINGGRLAHSGEVELLKKLLSACTGTSPIYREFCINILVPRAKLNHLDYADGLQLYDAAIAALPFEDRTLKHQRGLWIKDKSNNPLLAKIALEEALKAKVFPYTTRGEAEEHIHTSLAATILDAADRGQLALEAAIPEILLHLDRARSDIFFNPRAVHVEANLMLRLVTKLEQRDSADTYQLLNQALVDVDSTLLVLKNPLRKHKQQLKKDVELLEHVSGKIYENIMPLDELEESATDLWNEFYRQDGFVIAGRKRYHLARTRNSGTAYNEAFSYCREVIALIQASGQTPSGDLCAVAACIFYEWNVNRYDFKAPNRDVDWQLLYELSDCVVRSQKFARDPLYKFMCAVALAQQDKWPEAQVLFGQTRNAGIIPDQLYQVRAVLLDEQGTRKRVQGTITGSDDRKYLKVQELHTDFYVSRKERWGSSGEIAHAYIAFTFAGPLAVQAV
jgi:hypothetical protein